MNLNGANDEISVPFLDDKNPDFTRVCGSTPLVVRNLRLLVETPGPYLREYTNRNNNLNRS